MANQKRKKAWRAKSPVAPGFRAGSPLKARRRRDR
jgi:hypothetical protein